MWQGRKVLVTGGASFIGSHLVDRLLELEADVLVVDNMSSGKLTNLPQQYVSQGRFHLYNKDLRNPAVARSSMVEREVVFHLAANHGGRGYVDSHELECAGNMILDQVVMHAASDSRHVKYVVNASSACVYPTGLQNVGEDLLTEEDVRHLGNGYEADHMYGWAKLMGEFVMNECIKAKRFRGTSLRYFTVYGPRMGVSHAVGAWIMKVIARQDPFIIWGDGQQTRSWIYVGDVVEATIAAAENLMLDQEEITGEYTPQAINVGSPQHIKVIDAALNVLNMTGHECRIDFDESQPTGPRHRAADVGLAGDSLDWQPTTSWAVGLKKTIEWFYNTYTPEQAAFMLTKLKER